MTVHHRLGPPPRPTFGADLDLAPCHMARRRRRPVRRLVAVGVLMLGLAAGCLTGIACSAPEDGVTPRDCADRDNAEVCAP